MGCKAMIKSPSQLREYAGCKMYFAGPCRFASNPLGAIFLHAQYGRSGPTMFSVPVRA